MKGMSLELSTNFIQYMMIALIHANTETRPIVPDDEYSEMMDALTEMNKMCSAENNYTLSVEVTA